MTRAERWIAYVVLVFLLLILYIVAKGVVCYKPNSSDRPAACDWLPPRIGTVYVLR